MSLLQPSPSWTDVTKELNRFTKLQLLTLPENLDSIFDVTDPHFDQECRPGEKAPKYDVVAGYLRHLKRNTDSWSAFLHLKLQCSKYNVSRKVWKIFQGDQTTAQTNDVGRSPEEIEDQLQHALSLTHKSKIVVQMHDEAYWINVAIKPKKARTGTNLTMVCIVHYAHTSCFASVSMAVKLRDVICRAMESVFRLSNVALTAMQDHNLESLFQLQQCHTFPEMYTERGMESVSPMEEEPIPDYDPRIIDLQAVEKAERSRAFKRKFGWEKAPPITKLTYQLHTAYGGRSHLSQRRDFPAAALVETKLNFDGADVLNSIYQMVEAGISIGSLPKHLTGVRTLGRTHFLLRPRGANAP